MGFFLYPADLVFGTTLSFLLGLFAVSVGWSLLILFALATISAAISVFLRRRLWRDCLIFLFALLFSTFYYHLFQNWQSAMVNLPFNRHISFEAVVSDEPQPSDRYLILTTRTAVPLRGTVKVLAPPMSHFGYGDLLKVEGTIEPPDAKGGYPIVFSPKIELFAKHKGFFLREWMIDFKLAILEKFKEILSPDEAALLGGITFGSKQNFKVDLKAAMAASGLTHLVAVSGYNITIVIFAVGQVFGRFFSRRATFYAGIFSLLLFMFMVGGAASGVRAAIMGFLALTARQLGRTFSMRNAIALTGLGMALFDPTILTQNVGFILSFLSLMGIVYIGPPIKRLLKQEETGFFDWRENAITTLSAQLAVMPVLIHTFGQFSATAILANILVLSTVPLTMFFGFVLALLAFASRYLSFFAGKIAGLLLHYQLSVIQLFAKLAIPLPVTFNSELAMALYYLALAAFVYIYQHEKT